MQAKVYVTLQRLCNCFRYLISICPYMYTSYQTTTPSSFPKTKTYMIGACVHMEVCAIYCALYSHWLRLSWFPVSKILEFEDRPDLAFTPLILSWLMRKSKSVLSLHEYWYGLIVVYVTIQQNVVILGFIFWKYSKHSYSGLENLYTYFLFWLTPLCMLSVIQRWDLKHTFSVLL